MSGLSEFKGKISDLADSIRYKAGVSTPLTLDEMKQAVDNISTHTPTILENHEKDINFVDIDGAIIVSYTVEEFQSITDLPDMPYERAGLTFEGWNWTIADIRNFIDARPVPYKRVFVGPHYVPTADPATTIFNLVVMKPSNELKFTLCAYAGDVVEIDWGDGSARESITGTGYNNNFVLRHTYTTDGIYAMKVIGGRFTINNAKMFDSFYTDEVETPNNTILAQRQKSAAAMVRSVHLGTNAVRMGYTQYYMLRNCRYMSIPKSTVWNATSVYNMCFDTCSSLRQLTAPYGIKHLAGQCAARMAGMKYLSLPPTLQSSETGGTQMFGDWQTAEEIIIPHTMTLGYGSGMFVNCFAMLRIYLPIYRRLGHSTFKGCYNIRDITFSTYVESFDNPGSYSNGNFYQCYSLKYLDFSRVDRVPTLNSILTFSITTPGTWSGYLAQDLEIIVPDELYDEWVSATNWSDTAIVAHTVKKSESTKYGVNE